MNTRLLAELENAIQAWMNENCGEDDWPNAYVYDGQAVDMAKAASLVFDASVRGQTCAKDNRA